MDGKAAISRRFIGSCHVGDETAVYLTGGRNRSGKRAIALIAITSGQIGRPAARFPGKRKEKRRSFHQNHPISVATTPTVPRKELGLERSVAVRRSSGMD